MAEFVAVSRSNFDNKIGTADLTTTAQTVIGAVNELNGNTQKVYDCPTDLYTEFGNTRDFTTEKAKYILDWIADNVSNNTYGILKISNGGAYIGQFYFNSRAYAFIELSAYYNSSHGHIINCAGGSKGSTNGIGIKQYATKDDLLSTKTTTFSVTNRSAATVRLYRCGNIVQMSSVENFTSVSKSVWTTIGTIPTGYRPLNLIDGRCGNNNDIRISVTEQGVVRYYSSIDSTRTNGAFHFTWITGDTMPS